jgi:hypothetical protein
MCVDEAFTVERRRRTRPEAAQEELHHTKGRDDGHED